jgi:hypothetical protein
MKDTGISEPRCRPSFYQPPPRAALGCYAVFERSIIPLFETTLEHQGLPHAQVESNLALRASQQRRHELESLEIGQESLIDSQKEQVQGRPQGQPQESHQGLPHAQDRLESAARRFPSARRPFLQEIRGSSRW